MTPQRIQRRRTAGWRMPEHAIYVGRPTRWGNPFQIVHDPTGHYVTDHTGTPRTDPITQGTRADIDRQLRQHAVDLYQLHLGPKGSYELTDTDLTHLRDTLAGHDLACWCPTTGPCHADVLLDLANPPQ